MLKKYPQLTGRSSGKLSLPVYGRYAGSMAPGKLVVVPAEDREFVLLKLNMLSF